MSDQPPAPAADIDIAPANAAALSMQVLDSQGQEPGDYLRLGRANGADEYDLPQDPARAAPGDPRIGEPVPIGLGVPLPIGTGDPLLTVTPRTATEASPFNDGALLYSTSGIQMVAPHGYVRIGPASEYERWLPYGSDTRGTAAAHAVPADTVPGTGVMIFSHDSVHTVAPTHNVSSDSFTSYIADSLQITGDRDALVSATRNWGSSAHASSMQFQRTNTYQAQLGSAVLALTGNDVTQYLGNLITSGIGGQFTSNYGMTQTVYGGQTVSIQNAAMQVAGWRSAALASSIEQAAVGRMSLSCSPLVAVGLAAGLNGVLTTAIIAATLSAVGQIVLDSIMPAQLVGSWHGIPVDPASTRAAMDAAVNDMEIIEGLTLGAQVLATLVGLIGKLACDASVGSPFGSIEIEDGLGVQMICGPTSLLVTPVGVVVDGPMLDVNTGLMTVFGMAQFL